MAKHRQDDSKLEQLRVDTTLYDRGLTDQPKLLPVETRDKELQSVIDANRARRANMMYSFRSMMEAGAYLSGRGEEFTIDIKVPDGI